MRRARSCAPRRARAAARRRSRAPRGCSTVRDDRRLERAPVGRRVARDLADSTGMHGRAMRLDFDFHGHGGYAIARKKFDIALPENYAPPSHSRQRRPRTSSSKLDRRDRRQRVVEHAVNVRFPEEWRTVTLKKRRHHLRVGTARRRRAAHIAATRARRSRRGAAARVRSGSMHSTFTPLEPSARIRERRWRARRPRSADHAAALAIRRQAPRPGGGANIIDDAQIVLARPSARRASTAARRSTGSPVHAARNYVVETSTDGAKWDSRVRGERRRTAAATGSTCPRRESRYVRLRIPARASRVRYGSASSR